MAWEDVVMSCLRDDVEDGKITEEGMNKELISMFLEWKEMGGNDWERPPSSAAYYERFCAEKLPPGFVVNHEIIRVIPEHTK